MVCPHTRFASRTLGEPSVVDARPGGDGHLLDVCLGCRAGIVGRSAEADPAALAVERVRPGAAWRIEHADVRPSSTRQPWFATWLAGAGPRGGPRRGALR